MGWFKRNVDLHCFVGHCTDVRLTYMAARCFCKVCPVKNSPAETCLKTTALSSCLKRRIRPVWTHSNLSSERCCCHRLRDSVVGASCCQSGRHCWKWRHDHCHHLLTLMRFQTYISFFVILNTKEDILKTAGNSKSWWSPLTSIVFLSLLWKSMGTNNCLVLQNFVFNIRNKFW